MACSKPVQSGLRRLIECSICFEVYQHPHKVPKNLECGHTFCSECLAKLIKTKQNNCSACRRMTLVPNGDVNKLATNFTALDLLETSCEECRNQQWVTRCSHCDKNVCGTCHNVHLKQSDMSDKVEKAKKRITQISEICNDDTYLRDLDNNAEAAEEEVIEYWDDVSSKVEERKKQDLMKIRHHHKEACEEFMKWKENVQVSVLEAKSAVEKFSSRHGRKYLGPITLEEVEDINQEVVKLVVDLETDVSHKPVMAEYEINLKGTALQTILEDGVVEIVYDECATYEKITIQPSNSNQLTQYNQATHSLTYGQYGWGAGQFVRPIGIACCRNTGNIAIADYGNHRIHILTSSFQPVSVSGSEGSGDGQYKYPWGVAVNPNTDQIYVVDKVNNRIQVLKGNGSYHSVFSYHGSGHDVLKNPKDIAIDKSGLLYVCDDPNNKIKVIHPDGRLITSFGRIGPGPGQFTNDPWFIALSQDNKLVVSDSNGHLYIFTSQGQHIRTIQRGQPGGFDDATGVAIDQLGNIIVADGTGYLVVLREDGEVVCKIGSPGEGPGQLNQPRGVALTPEGGIVVADSGNSRIQLFEVPKA